MLLLIPPPRRAAAAKFLERFACHSMRAPKAAAVSKTCRGHEWPGIIATLPNVQAIQMHKHISAAPTEPATYPS